MWRVLLFIESRDFLDERYPNRNPAVEWDRLARCVVDLGLQALGSERNVPGGSTVATQLEKFRHAPEGRTGSARAGRSWRGRGHRPWPIGYGCSGGGVLTAWVVGHTDRFAAAVSQCPVINWVSLVGNVDGNPLRWYEDFEKFPWEDSSEHLRRSPLMYVGNVKTPTALMTGVLDMRTPISQTEEFYQALKAVGAPTAMLRFNDEWHGTASNPSNFLRTQLYLRYWFEKWMTKDDPASGR